MPLDLIVGQHPMIDIGTDERMECQFEVRVYSGFCPFEYSQGLAEA
jgi:hypothetical protein